MFIHDEILFLLWSSEIPHVKQYTLEKKSACTFRRDFKIFQTAAKTAAAARSKVVRAVSARLRGRGVRAVPRGQDLRPRSPLWS